MPTLLLRFAGPLQSWGTSSRFDIRDTGSEPSKSGVIGVLCAALGKPRVEDAGSQFPSLQELCALRLGVRADTEGQPLVDFHTVGGGSRRNSTGTDGILRASGKLSYDPVVSRRHYLTDANFLVGVEGDGTLLDRLRQAVLSPVWAVYLGRKACLPAPPIAEPLLAGYGWSEAPLEEALAAAPRDPAGVRRAVLDAEATLGTETRYDVPLSFAPRRFALRHVRVTHL